MCERKRLLQVVLGLLLLIPGASALALALAVPANFQATVIDGGDKVRLTWTSPAPQVRVFVQKKVANPNGTFSWQTQMGDAALGELTYPRNVANTGSHVVNTHATTLGEFRFFLKAKSGSTYSDETVKLIRTGLH